jgi:hypothetical protein
MVQPDRLQREGYRCLVLDVFDPETLRKRAPDGPNIPAASIYQIWNVSPEKVSADFGLDSLFSSWMQLLHTNNENYSDAHCSVFTPNFC